MSAASGAQGMSFPMSGRILRQFEWYRGCMIFIALVSKQFEAGAFCFIAGAA